MDSFDNIHFNKELNLVNPEEIFRYIRNKRGIVDLINKSVILIKKYFPNSNLYLKFVEDSELESLDVLFTYIKNKENSVDENFNVFLELLDGFIDLKSQFNGLESSYSIRLN